MANVVAPKIEIPELSQPDLGRPVLSAKIFRYACRANHLYKLAHPAPARGALRDRHGCRVRDAMDAMAHETNATIADGEGVWSWRPLAGAKPADDDHGRR